MLKDLILSILDDDSGNCKRTFGCICLLGLIVAGIIGSILLIGSAPTECGNDENDAGDDKNIFKCEDDSHGNALLFFRGKMKYDQAESLCAQAEGLILPVYDQDYNLEIVNYANQVTNCLYNLFVSKYSLSETRNFDDVFHRRLMARWSG